jgi:fumarate hydratase class II
MSSTRREHDSLGDVEVPAGAFYAAQTQRAIDNFRIAGRPLPPAFIHAVALIKREAAAVNAGLGLLPAALADAIARAADAVLNGDCADQFPVDVYQTGSGTSTNMNVNEVLAHLAANLCGEPVHPNDHVNTGQSSNDVIPTALQLACALEVHRTLLPALEQLADTLDQRGRELADVVKTGRTHLMDAMPIRLDQELSGWRAQVLNADERIEDSLDRLCELPLGGTAVGTGVNTDPEFGPQVIARLAQATGLALTPCRNRYERMASLDSAVELSGQLRVLALALIKISNDLRWMNSGPYCGLGEIRLAALQPGSSIMPGKVNPVIPEAVAMAAAQCAGLDAANALAGQSGNFQLNVMLPLVADNLLAMIGLLGRACTALAGRGGLLDFEVNSDHLAAQAAKNPILATALAPLIGYEKAAAIAKRAIAENCPILAVAQEMTDLDAEQLSTLLDPRRLTEGGIVAPGGGG